MALGSIDELATGEPGAEVEREQKGDLVLIERRQRLLQTKRPSSSA